MKYRGLISKVLNLGITFILVSVPFYALLSVWGSSLVGHYTLLRLYTEVILVICLIAAIGILVIDAKIRKLVIANKLVWLIILYGLLVLVVGGIAYFTKNVTAKAFGYGLIVDTRYLLFFLVVWVATLSSDFLRKHWVPILLWPAAVVTVFGLLQAFVLPRDFLRHFGYGASTISPYQTINHNQGYVRIQSTLRGVNPYGAYLVVLISFIGALITKFKKSWIYLVFMAASLVTLVYTFSRSAWIGTFVALALIALIYIYKTKLFIPIVSLGLIFVLIVSVIVTGNHNSRLQNIFLHTQSNTSIKTTSDQGHLSGLKSGLKDIYHQPLGAGTGTAGPASAYNPSRIRIAENYFIQIGQETGLIGLFLFLSINIILGVYLWRNRSDILALGLFVSLVGVTVVNLFSHAWADPTLSFLWWGLAGISMKANKTLSKKKT